MLDRKCVACRQIKNQKELLRIAKIGSTFVLDKQQKLGGRGAYICNNSGCIGATIKKRLLNKAYKMNIESDIYNKLGEYEQSL